MGILASTASLTRYRVNGQLGENPIEQVESGLKRYKIVEIDNEPEDISVGWTSLNDPYHPDFDGSSFLVASYFIFSLRIDKKSVPANVLKKHVIMEEKKRLRESGREFLSKNEKKELREDVKQMLLTRMPPVPHVYDAVWDHETSMLWFYSTQKAANEELETLFLKSFNINLIKLFPYTLADLEMNLSDTEKNVLYKLKPSRFME
jgi:DNA recombination-dependent growth factor C